MATCPVLREPGYAQGVQQRDVVLCEDGIVHGDVRAVLACERERGMSSWQAPRTSGKTHYSEIITEGEQECELGACVTRSGRAAQAQAEHVCAAEAQGVHCLSENFCAHTVSDAFGQTSTTDVYTL